MFVRLGRKVNDANVSIANVQVGVPDIGRNGDNSGIFRAEIKVGNLLKSRAVRSNIVAHNLHASVDQEIPVFMLLVQAPAFRAPLSDRIGVDKVDRVRVKVPASIKKLSDSSSIIYMGFAGIGY